LNVIKPESQNNNFHVFFFEKKSVAEWTFRKRSLVNVQPVTFVCHDIEQEFLFVGTFGKKIIFSQLQISRLRKYFSTDLHFEGSPAMRALMKLWSLAVIGIPYSAII